VPIFKQTKKQNDYGKENFYQQDTQGYQRGIQRERELYPQRAGGSVYQLS
jgi:hypothetical protein